MDKKIELDYNYAVLMANIISVISKRGGFMPDEFKSVGELFEVLKNEINEKGEKKLSNADIIN
jgi:hypothetical protein